MKKDEVFPFESVKKCVKCEWFFIQPQPGRYNKPKNLIIRKCSNCGYEWFEEVADGTAPIIRTPRKRGG